MEFPCFFYDWMNVGHMISDSSAFYKSSLNIWKYSDHVLWKPSLENFEHYFASMWNEYNCVVVWTFLGIAFFQIGIKTDHLQSCGHCWISKFGGILSAALTALSFRIWNSSVGISSLPLVLLVVILPKAQLASQSRMSSSRWVTDVNYTIMVIWVIKTFFV